MIKTAPRGADTTIVTELRRPHPLMSVLAAGIPLTLLLDLAADGDVDSARIFRRETADVSWLTGLRATARHAVRPARATGRRAAR